MTVPVMDSSGLSWYNWTKADKDHVMCVFNYSTAFFNCNSDINTYWVQQEARKFSVGGQLALLLTLIVFSTTAGTQRTSSFFRELQTTKQFKPSIRWIGSKFQNGFTDHIRFLDQLNVFKEIFYTVLSLRFLQKNTFLDCSPSQLLL